MYEKIAGFNLAIDISAATISPGKGDLVAVSKKINSCYHQIILLDAETGKQVGLLEGHSEEITCLCFTPDGKMLLSGGKDNSIKYWNLATGKLDRPPLEGIMPEAKDDECYISSICFSPDCRLLCYTADDLAQSAMITETQMRLFDNRGANSDVQSLISCSISKCWSFNQRLQFSPHNNKWLAAVKDERVFIFAVSATRNQISYELAWQSDEFEDFVYTLAFSHDGKKLVAVDDSGAIKVWTVIESDEGDELRLDLTHSVKDCGFYCINNIQILPLAADKLEILIGCYDTWSEVAVFECMNDSDKIQLKRTLTGHKPKSDDESSADEDGLITVELSTSGNRLISATYKDLIVWQLSSTTSDDELDDHDARVTAVCFSPDGAELASAAGLPDCSIRLWCLDSGKDRLRLRVSDEKAPVECLAYHCKYPQNPTLMASYSNGSIRFWNAQEGTAIGAIKYPTLSSRSYLPCTFCPSGRYILAGGDGGFIRIWEFDNDKKFPLINSIGAHADSVTSLGFSSSGKMLFSTSTDKTVKIWKFNEMLPPPKSPYNYHTMPKKSIKISQISPEEGMDEVGKRAAAANTNKIHSSAFAVLANHTDETVCAVFSPDDKYIFTAAIEGNILGWKVSKGRHESPTYNIADSENAKLLFFDGWNLRSVHKLSIFTWKRDYSGWNNQFFIDGIKHSVTAAVAHPDVKNQKAKNHSVAIGSFDCTVRIIRLADERLTVRLQGKAATAAFDEVKYATEGFALTERPDWFQSSAKNCLAEVLLQESMEESISLVNFDFTCLPGDFSSFGVWIDKAALFDSNAVSTFPIAASRILVQTSPRLCSADILIGLLKQAEASEREYIVHLLANGSLPNEEFKLQKVFDFLASDNENDETAIYEMLWAVRKTENVWIPLIQPDYCSASILCTVFEHITKCIKMNREAIKLSDWKFIAQNISSLVGESPPIATEFFNALSYYPIPNYKAENMYLASIVSDDFEVAPQPKFWGYEPDLYMRDTDDDDLYDFLQKCFDEYGGLTNPKRKSSERLNKSYISRVMDSLMAAIRPAFRGNRKKIASANVVVCFVPLYRIYGGFLKQLSNETKDNALLKTPAMRVLVDYKWQMYGRKLYYIWLISYLTMIAVFFVSHFSMLRARLAGESPSWPNLTGFGIVTFFSACFLLIEIKEFSESRSLEYFKSFSNWLDLFSYIVPVLHLANLLFGFVEIPPLLMASFVAFTTIILFFGALNLMVAAGEIGKFVRMFFEVIKATRYFLITLLIFLFAFLLAFSTLALYTPQTSAFLSLYLILIGQSNLEQISRQLNQVDDSSSAFSYGSIVLFVVFTFFVMIIMFNLLISLIGDIHQTVNENIGAFITRSKLNMLTKVESFYPYTRNTWTSDIKEESPQFPDWLVYIVPEDVYEEYHGISES